MEIVTWLKDNAALLSLIIVILGLIYSILCLIWELGRIYEYFSQKIKTWNDNSTKIADIENEVKNIGLYLISKDESAKNFLGMKNSPLILNDRGKLVYETIQGDEFFEKNKEFLMDSLTAKNPRMPLDVEISARAVLMELINNPMFDCIKNIVYSHPAIKVKNSNGEESDYVMTLADVCFVLSIPLRDMYLEAHKEIEQQAEKSDTQK